MNVGQWARSLGAVGLPEAFEEMTDVNALSAEELSKGQSQEPG